MIFSQTQIDTGDVGSRESNSERTDTTQQRTDESENIQNADISGRFASISYMKMSMVVEYLCFPLGNILQLYDP